jgi:excisionase family DNA binding protein
MLEKHYSIEEIAEQLGVDYSTVWRWIRAGKLKWVKLGKAVRVPASVVAAFLKERTIG